MIKGVGLDIIEIDRIKKVMQRSEKLQKRVLSQNELHIFEQLTDHRKIEFLAGRFAAKEAYSKANGTGIREGCEFHQIEIINNELGKPEIFFDGQVVSGFVSITHTKEYAAAQVILME